MRILDLGCHDGYIASWLGRTLAGELTIDGIDANSHAVGEFNRRMKDHGIGGTAKIGLAENAPTLFEEGTYDAVIAFELIEHVPDVEAFLAVCERMLKPGGVVYLSTPDGTFGAGQNPHHLRVYRSIDLCDLARRRGKLVDGRTGPDGITFLAYQPPFGKFSSNETCQEVGIYLGGGWKEWNPANMVMPGGLGGSETAAVRVAEQLAERGANVTIYGQVEETVFKQVILRNHETFDPTEHRDLLIVSRRPDIADLKPNADKMLLWMHDTDYGPLLSPSRIDRFDGILVLSEWHRRFVKSCYEIPDTKLHVVRNGIHPPFFRDVPLDAERPPHAIYTSSPDRGLDFLLELWPEVMFHVPDAVLGYCYADVYQTVAAARPEVGAHWRHIEKLAKACGKGAQNLGNLSQPDLVRAMAGTRAWLAPSWNTPNNVRFHETFCIGAIESMLAGCNRVVSGWGALPERSGEGWPGCVVAPAHDDEVSPPHRELWIEAIVQALDYNGDRSHPEPADFGWSAAVDTFPI